MLTGAGISTESGIPDFRGPNGVWTKDPAAEKTATLEYYMGDPEVRRRAWQNRLSRARYWRPSPTPRTARSSPSSARARCTSLVTQNIDGLHHAAGQSPEHRRGDPRQRARSEVHDVRVARADGRDPRSGARRRSRPACEHCGGILKSATISFGENLVADDLERAQRDAARADVFLALGTSLGVYPAAALPEIARRPGRAS